jgi:uncharacterized protein YndB with AHSA1/START domain
MPASPDALLQDHEGRPVLRFERVLAQPPERVWKALTEPDELAHWHPSPARFEAHAGGTVTYLPQRGKPMFPEGEVIAYEPPRVLEHTWGEDQLRWELEPRADGCLLILTHTFDDRFKAARDAAGWHLCLDALSGALDGAAQNEPPTGDIPPAWPALNSAYEQRFGILPEQATPPPVG